MLPLRLRRLRIRARGGEQLDQPGDRGEPTAGFDQGKICTLNGGYLSFPKTKAELVALGDPRPWLEERNGNDKAYVDAVKAAAARAVAERFLLRADGHYLVAEAAGRTVKSAALLLVAGLQRNRSI